MEKYYNIDGRIYRFEKVEAHKTRPRLFFGFCREKKSWAWLDPCGVQFEGKDRQAAREVSEPLVDNSKMYWGGELRSKLPHGAEYYRRGWR